MIRALSISLGGEWKLSVGKEKLLERSVYCLCVGRKGLVSFELETG